MARLSTLWLYVTVLGRVFHEGNTTCVCMIDGDAVANSDDEDDDDDDDGDDDGDGDGDDGGGDDTHCGGGCTGLQHSYVMYVANELGSGSLRFLC